jgi:MFS family permease
LVFFPTILRFYPVGSDMAVPRGFAYITLADFVARAAYQMGKTPLLPIFALALGAGDTYLGFIVSVSTLTGMALKPFIGIFSDRWGRRRWLLIGTAFFAVMPFVYRFVHTPDQLFLVRIVHGLATAIYGPVTLAYVAEQSRKHVAERLGWFSMARSAGYIVGPAVAGWLLLTLTPVSVFTIIGFLSCIVFVPVLLLPEQAPQAKEQRSSLPKQVVQALGSGSCNPLVWLAGGLETAMYIALYAIKAFLPVHAMRMSISVALVGIFFSIQEVTSIILKPWCGKLADRLGCLLAISFGMGVLAVALLLITYAEAGLILMIPSILMGIAQALITPSTLALVLSKVDRGNVGAAMGLIGTLRNAGKVVGPILAGVLIKWLNFNATFRSIGCVAMIGSIGIISRIHISRYVPKPRHNED